MKFAIVDVETTGSKYTEDRIIDIAIIIHNGRSIEQTFESLVNPERHIPEFITQLTGISNEMVASAPKFYEIAKQIVTLTRSCVFVAHNVHFDYGFVKQEFKRLGYQFVRKTLCTVRLSRQLFKGLPSYNLDSLSKYFQIQNHSRHRAMGDAQVAAYIFEQLWAKNTTILQKNILDNEIKAPNLPPKISQEQFEKLPEETGIYYFYNEQGNIIYIGKSKNIKKRVASHFATNLQDKKSIPFKNQVADISYELTGSELVALLLESDEIKKHTPLFNKQQRKSKFQYGIFRKKNREGYIELFIDKINHQPTKTPLIMLDRYETAKRVLEKKVSDFQLCQSLCSLYTSKQACFNYHVKLCAGACLGKESPESYNKRALQAIDSFNKYARKSFLIVEQGRNEQEKAIILVEKGQYKGWGYIDKWVSIQNLEEAYSYIKRYADNRDTQKIIRTWLKNKKIKIVYFE
ncbi:MAG: exonuclease domain-containing protein [Microscillaceae bacterium]|nr:exonuclease domain-containing protein [Microscillaceae bacterium]MDW8461933.1 exonuclease domain-containing protein [Cytophagales bacterium]